MGLRKEFQAVGNRTMYVWQHDLIKVDTINVKQVTIFNDFVCCKRPKYDFWISQGSVATLLR